MYILIIVITVILICAGMTGLFFPFLPDLPLVWLGIFILSAYTHFEKVSLATNIIFLGLVILAYVFDYLATIYGAKKMGASKWGIIGGIGGGIIGLSIGGFTGLIIGPILGAFCLEVLLAGKEVKHALRAGFGAFLGFIAGLLTKISLIFIMVGVFLWQVFF
ncbi:MAG: DUF456 domain-containing protein [Patescibacteria group bacterium]